MKDLSSIACSLLEDEVDFEIHELTTAKKKWSIVERRPAFALEYSDSLFLVLIIELELGIGDIFRSCWRG